MIQFDASDLLTLPAAARSLPGNVNPATMWRWATTGRNGVRLGTIKIGRSRYTTRRELQRFLIASDPAQEQSASTVPISQDEADRFLESEGL